MQKSKLATKVWAKENLYKAWLKVSESSRKSASRTIRAEADEYSNGIIQHINSLCGRLAANSFEFGASRGVLMARKGKSDRPIVVAPIENKIVQRAILNVINDTASLNTLVKSPLSFGGVYDTTDKRNVGSAIAALRMAMEDDKAWFVKSDIRNFFVGIPRHEVVNEIRARVSDSRFVELFAAAAEVELDNLAILGAKAEAFPIHEIGVAQGCCLSPFIGNALLRGFDEELNKRGIRCLRYIDDFIILAKHRSAAMKAFDAAKQLLNAFRLDVHDPGTANSKTVVGQMADGIEFLGIEVRGELIVPSNVARVRLLQKLDKIIDDSTACFDRPSDAYSAGLSLSRTLRRIDGTITGWIGQYRFCNDVQVLRNLNDSIDERITRLLGQYNRIRQSLPESDKRLRRELLGVKYLLPEDWSTDAE